MTLLFMEADPLRVEEQHQLPQLQANRRLSVTYVQGLPFSFKWKYLLIKKLSVCSTDLNGSNYTSSNQHCI